MWKIRGLEYRLGDSVFVARGALFPKAERFTITRPRGSGGGWLFGTSYDTFAWATNGKEIIRINRRGRIVDDVFSDRRIISFDEGRRLEHAQKANASDTNPPISGALKRELDDCDTSTAKARVLLNEGWEELDVAAFLHMRPQLVRQVALQAKERF